MLELLVIRGKWESMICYIFVVWKLHFRKISVSCPWWLWANTSQATRVYSGILQRSILIWVIPHYLCYVAYC